MKDIISTSKLAEKWGCSRRYVQEEIKRRNLTGMQLGRNWFVVLDAKLVEWEANPRRATRTKVSVTPNN